MAEALLGGLAVGGLDGRGYALGVALEALDPGAGEDRHALLGERLGERVGHVLVLDRHDAVEHFDDRHLGAHVIVEAGEFDPDRARSDDQQLGRHFGRGHGVAIGPDAFAVGLGERQVAGAGTGGEDDVFGGELGLLAVLGDGQFVRRGQRAVAHVHVDLVLLHQMRDALIELLGDRAAAGDDLGEVGGRRAPGAEAKGVGMVHVMEDFGRAKQCLGRDAAPVEADAAEILALDDRGLEAELRGADGGDIAAGTGAEDDEIVSVRHYYLSFPQLLSAGRHRRARRR